MRTGEIVSDDYEDDTAVREGSGTEAAILFTVATFGCLGNLMILLAIMMIRKLRHSATAFLFHHCCLDLLKSILCVPFGYGLLESKEMPFCSVIGSSYILLMMTSSYNLIALVVGEEYQLQDCCMAHGHQKENYCCIFFGIFMIWFGNVLINLGISFIPSSPKFDHNIGICVLRYGQESQFILHSIWIILVTGAIATALIYFRKLYVKVKNRINSQKWQYIHEAVSSGREIDEGSAYQFLNLDEKINNKFKCNTKAHVRRIVLYIGMVMSIIVFWYPLFILEMVDLRYTANKTIYRTLTILAWSQPVVTPILAFFILMDIRYNENPKGTVCSRLIPLKTTNRELSHSVSMNYQAFEETRSGLIREPSLQRRFSFLQSMEDDNELIIENVGIGESEPLNRSRSLFSHCTYEV